MSNGILRVVRCDRMTIQPSDGSVRKRCSRCGEEVYVWQRSLAIAPELRLVCDVCLPAEPIGPIGAP